MIKKPRDKSRRSTIVSSVLEAASTLLPLSGYLGATTNRIADKAGVSIGSLYYYFKSKDEVYQELSEEIISDYWQVLEAKLEQANSVLEIHVALINTSVDFVHDNRDLLRSLFSMAPKLGKMEKIFDLRNEFSKILAQKLLKIDPHFNGSEKNMIVFVNAVNGVLDNYIYGTTCPLTRDENEKPSFKTG